MNEQREETIHLERINGVIVATIENASAIITPVEIKGLSLKELADHSKGGNIQYTQES